MNSEILLTLRSPIYLEKRITVSPKWTILSLKKFIHKDYDIDRNIYQINLIHAGYLLKSDQIIENICGKNNNLILYLVLTNSQLNSFKDSSLTIQTFDTNECYYPHYLYPCPLYNYWMYNNSQFYPNYLYPQANTSSLITNLSQPRSFIGQSLNALQNLINNNVANENEANNNRDNNININNNIDWLDWAYTFFRLLILFSILYFYSSINRFLIVMFFSTILFLYQAGLLLVPLRHRINQINNNENLNLNPNDMRNIEGNLDNANSAQENNNPANSETESANHEIILSNTQNQSLRFARILGRYPTMEHFLRGVYNGCKLFIAIFISFFSSLVPERPPPIDLN